MARGIYALGVRGLFPGNGRGGIGITPLCLGSYPGLWTGTQGYVILPDPVEVVREKKNG